MARKSTSPRLRDHGASILVAGLSSAFGVALLQVTGALAAAIQGDDVTGSSHTVGIMLGIVATVFIVIAVYVGAIVTANTFATIVAGRARTIALLRLIGSTASAQRRTVAREGLVVGVLGALGGAVVGTALAVAVMRVAITAGVVPDFDYGWNDPVLLVPIVGVVLTTWLASWVGSRRVLTVTPLQAIGGSQELSREQTLARPKRNGAAITLMVLGFATLWLGIAVGLANPIGVLVGVVGGVLSFTGLVIGSQLIMPPALRLVGRMLGRSPSARLAAENALRYPERSSRTTIGVVIGVTLITMFGVAVASFKLIILSAQAAQPEIYEGTEQMLDAVTAVFSALIGVSALIAAVGLVNSLSLSVLQRTRELGLLRALGFTVKQLRRMILAESVQLTATAVLLGLVLGTFYGWAGAQSLLGSINGVPGLVLPGVPWAMLAIVVAAAALLTGIATIVPSRRATRVSPVTALAVE
jgi:putative ABC transport system permease protein